MCAEIKVIVLIGEEKNKNNSREMDSSAAAAAANAMLGISSSTRPARKSSLTLAHVLSTVMDVVVFLSVSVGYIVQVSEKDKGRENSYAIRLCDSYLPVATRCLSREYANFSRIGGYK